MRTGQSIEIEDEEEDDWLLAANGERGMANPQRRYADTQHPLPSPSQSEFLLQDGGGDGNGGNRKLFGGVPLGSRAAAKRL